MFPSPLRNFGARFGGVGDSSKAERQGERQSTIKRAPLDVGAGGRRVRTHTDRLTNTINHFFSRVARLVQLKRGCWTLLRPHPLCAFASVFISIFWSVDGKPLEFLWRNAKFSFEMLGWKVYLSFEFFGFVLRFFEYLHMTLNQNSSLVLLMLPADEWNSCSQHPNWFS